MSRKQLNQFKENKILMAYQKILKSRLNEIEDEERIKVIEEDIIIKEEAILREIIKCFNKTKHPRNKSEELISRYNFKYEIGKFYVEL